MRLLILSLLLVLSGCATSESKLLSRIGLTDLQTIYDHRNWTDCGNGMMVFNEYLCNYEYAKQ
jgi:hypothetical protein